MDLFVRESGPVGAPAVVFLHGGLMSGWTWEPVVMRMQHYHCLVPDLPQYGKSFQHGPFEMGRAAEAVAELIRTRVSAGRAHLVGFSLGAQVGVQLLATQPQLIDRAVLSSTFINTWPAVPLTRRLAGLAARATLLRWLLITRHWDTHHAAQNPGYRDDARLNSGAQLAHIAMASAGFTVPRGLDTSYVPTLFVTGSEELRVIRRWAAALARPMPNGVDRLAQGMRHDWPLHNPDLFARTADAWLSLSPLPSAIV
ncbi:pimeloyl-ACP methyl ester carboxylesterase [Mycolicibacterium sp. BK556]|uniref:alpha/beta fold hydrolase n=1 Tax=Mycobacteriaceae TaxID=1762 RepID=UPI00105CC840|nr:alpha/beta hydrolase [Mycobacterium sp. BK086]MBB3606925.1 pimeloyl-ACP methyl ester carboxylesterase [Mycolicibacterium sp. BK556]MBB3636682.1 pimeloyl-ACP methyl ester carboxylesterase [Mycolicibacterium sp. BK607]MBB3753015.1 pimeloyl-ACP methyl ester carboxylesterase [Mycolicibacterium sp. BK634]